MLFIMEGIDLALLIQIFKGFKSTLPRPGPQDLPIFVGRGGARLAFLRGGAALFPRGGAGWGGAHIPDRIHGNTIEEED